MRVLAWNTPMNILTYILPTTLGARGTGQLAGMGYRLHRDGFAADRRPALGVAMLVASIIGVRRFPTARFSTPREFPQRWRKMAICPHGSEKFIRGFGTPARAIAVSDGCVLRACQISGEGSREHLYLDPHRDND